MIKKIINCLIVVLIFSHYSLSAWWDVGHMAVAKIAYEELLPEVKDKVDAYLEAVSGSFPHHSDFMTASVWADDIVHDGIHAFGEWHRAARPYDPHKVLTPQEHAKILTKFEDHDIVWAINGCLKTIGEKSSSPWAKGFMLRMLIHIVGDIHQPCHCVTFYSADFPKGDKTGTKYKIKHEVFKSLHALFDGAFGLTVRRPERPISEGDKAYLNDLVKHLRQKFPRDSFPQLSDCNIDHWRQDSYNLGVNFAYANILPHHEVPSHVMEEGKIVTGKQLALAGYRLADLLNSLLGSIPK
jgi:S1/P1 Nuclease